MPRRISEAVAAEARSFLESAGSFTSFVSQRTQESLIRQGLPAREAGQEAVRQNRLVAVCCRALEALGVMIAGVVAVPFSILALLFCVVVADLIAENGRMGVELLEWIFTFKHSDECDQPLGPLLEFYYISIASQFFFILLLFLAAMCAYGVATCFCIDLGENEDLRFLDQRQESECPRCCVLCAGGFQRVVWYLDILFMLVAFFCFVLELLIVSFLWCIWPFVACVYFFLARDCSLGLWMRLLFILLFYAIDITLAQIYYFRPDVFYKYGILSDPQEVQKTYPSISYDPELFKDDVENCFPASCPICLEDFTHGHDIVATPCEGNRHIFHRSCLSEWIKTRLTCPLCRSQLSKRHRGESTGEVQLGAVNQVSGADIM